MEDYPRLPVKVHSDRWAYGALRVMAWFLLIGGVVVLITQPLNWREWVPVIAAGMYAKRILTTGTI